jgi:tetratricopeptide (TPR) repeat protein
MISRPCWNGAALTFAVLAIIGLCTARFNAARAGAPDEPPKPGAEWLRPGPAQTGPAQDEEGPSSNADAKAAREPGPDEGGTDEDGLPPQGQESPDISADELRLEEPGQRAKVLGELYDALGRAKDAEDAVRIAESIEQIWRISGSDTVDLLLGRAETFVKESDLDLAARVLDSVVELAPDNAAALYQRGMVHFLQNDYQPAAADLRRALAIDPQHYKALNGLGVVLQALGDKKGALEALRKALKVNPFLDSARERIEELSRSVEGQDI